MYWKVFKYLLVIFVLAVNISFLKAEDAPIVLTSTGYIKGYFKKSYNGRKFRAFEGIPYAMPPIGKLRFGPPQPIFPWEGVAHTAAFGGICMQYNPFSTNPEGKVEGAEDCLYLNVYAPEQTNSSNLLPILFFIHGVGGFQFSAGSYFGSKYLLDRDIILVTMNYRLGPLGFLSTENGVVSGNLGLKDQGVALRWISRNAKAFGGDDLRITLAGQGSGAACVHFHYQSNWSKGYFQRGISASGTALHNWAMAEGSLEKAEKIADIVGCPKKTVNTMVDCMQHRPANQIVGAVGAFQPFLYHPFAPFAPVVDRKGRYPFMEAHPIVTFTEGRADDIPWLTGVTSQEGLYHIADIIKDKRLLKEVNDNWDQLAPLILNFNYTIPIHLHSQIARQIRNFYLKNKDIDESTVDLFINMVTDRLYFTDTEKAVRMHTRWYRSPVWMYEFSYSGAHSFTEKSTGVDRQFGVSHMDEIMYIFDTPYNNKNETATDRAMREKLIDIWVSFAENGYPKKSLKWTPVDPYRKNLHYLHISGPENIHMHHSSHLGEALFWDSIDFDENKLNR